MLHLLCTLASCKLTYCCCLPSALAPAQSCSCPTKCYSKIDSNWSVIMPYQMPDSISECKDPQSDPLNCSAWIAFRWHASPISLCATCYAHSQANQLIMQPWSLLLLYVPPADQVPYQPLISWLWYLMRQLQYQVPIGLLWLGYWLTQCIITVMPIEYYITIPRTESIHWLFRWARWMIACWELFYCKPRQVFRVIDSQMFTWGAAIQLTHMNIEITHNYSIINLNISF